MIIHFFQRELGPSRPRTGDTVGDRSGHSRDPDPFPSHLESVLHTGDSPDIRESPLGSHHSISFVLNSLRNSLPIPDSLLTSRDFLFLPSSESLSPPPFLLKYTDVPPHLSYPHPNPVTWDLLTTEDVSTFPHPESLGVQECPRGQTTSVGTLGD